MPLIDPSCRWDDKTYYQGECCAVETCRHNPTCQKDPHSSRCVSDRMCKGHHTYSLVTFETLNVLLRDVCMVHSRLGTDNSPKLDHTRPDSVPLPSIYNEYNTPKPVNTHARRRHGHIYSMGLLPEELQQGLACKTGMFWPCKDAGTDLRDYAARM